MNAEDRKARKVRSFQPHTEAKNQEEIGKVLAGLKKRGNPARLLKRLTGSEEKRLSFERRHVVC